MKTVPEPVLFAMISPVSNIYPAHSRHSKKYLLSNYSVPDTLIGSEDPTESTTFWWKEANKQRYGGWRSKWHYFLQKKILLLRNSSCLPQGHIASEWWCQDSHPDLLPLNPRFHHWVWSLCPSPPALTLPWLDVYPILLQSVCTFELLILLLFQQA